MSSLVERSAIAFHTTEAERLARLEKNARLRALRSHVSLLVFDPHAPFHDEIDCTAIFEELQGRSSKF